jgi:hypothetical protein
VLKQHWAARSHRAQMSVGGTDERCAGVGSYGKTFLSLQAWVSEQRNWLRGFYSVSRARILGGRNVKAGRKKKCELRTSFCSSGIKDGWALLQWQRVTLHIIAKGINHIERVYRKEEQPRLAQDYEVQQKTHREAFATTQPAESRRVRKQRNAIVESNILKDLSFKASTKKKTRKTGIHNYFNSASTTRPSVICDTSGPR